MEKRSNWGFEKHMVKLCSKYFVLDCLCKRIVYNLSKSPSNFNNLIFLQPQSLSQAYNTHITYGSRGK